MNKKLKNLLLKNRIRKIKLVLSLVLISIFVILVRLFYLQINQNNRLLELGRQNFLRTEVIQPMRGNVLDRNGNLLATNSPIFDLYWDGSGRFRLSTLQKSFVAKLSSILGNDVLSDGLIKKISRAERFSRKILIKKNISQDALFKISEQCSESANLFVDRHFRRVYPHKNLACHILGYLRKANDRGFFEGLCGLERKFQNDLRGEYGYVQHVINARGKKIDKRNERQAISGADVQLTLDLSMQKIAESLFVPGQAGAFIVMDPDDGSIRAMLSYPNFDPNSFLESISDQEWHDSFVIDSPLLNRAIHAVYPPASIFKLITFVSGFEEGIIDKETEFYCEGHTIFRGRKYNCQRRWGHGKLSATKALGVSCNIPCYEISQKTTIDHLAAYAMRFGLGQSTRFLFPDKSGLVPTSCWKQAHKGERWWKGETLSVSIGQSFLLVTPLQIVRMVASICNGYLVKPRIMVDEEIERYPLYVSEKTLDFLREVMKEVVLRGTGRCLRPFKGFSICAKTGTAQIVSLKKQQKGAKRQLEHAWFACFFSYKGSKPLAMVILVENAGSSRYALNIAKNFFTAYKNNLKQKQFKIGTF
jgi:penicillin-binding protein 2